MKNKILLILGLCLIFAACSDFSSSSSFKMESNSCRISGSTKQNARTAAPSKLSVACYVIKITCTSNPSDTYSDIKTDSGNFDFQVKPGTYKIDVNVYNTDSFSNAGADTLCFTGSKTDITVTEGQSITLDPIIVHPVIYGKGAVSLGVSTTESSIVKAAAEWEGISDFSIHGSQEIALVEGKTVFTFRGASDTDTYYFKSGTYYVTFSFYDSNNKCVFKTQKEIINVFDNLVTNSWYPSNAIYLNGGKFEITNTCLVAYVHSPVYYVASTGSDSNYGTYTSPLATIQKAVDMIDSVNDGSTEYKIVLLTNISAADGTSFRTKENCGNSFVEICPEFNDLNLTIESFQANVYKIDAKKIGGRVIFAGSDDYNLNLILKKVQVLGGSLGTTSMNSSDAYVSNTFVPAYSGGGIFVADNCKLKIENSVIGDITDEINSLTDGVQINSSTYTSVTSDSKNANFALSGAAIYIENKTTNEVSLTGSKVANNYSHCYGNVCNSGGKFSMDSSSEIMGNSIKKERGGGYIQYNSSETVIDGKIHHNVSISNRSCGIEVHGSGKFTLNENASVTDNSVLIEPNGSNNCTFGTGIHIPSKSDVKIYINGAKIEGNGNDTFTGSKNINLQSDTAEIYLSKNAAVQSVRMVKSNKFNFTEVFSNSSFNCKISFGYKLAEKNLFYENSSTAINNLSSNFTHVIDYFDQTANGETAPTYNFNNSWKFTEEGTKGYIVVDNTSTGDISAPGFIALKGELTPINDFKSATGGSFGFAVKDSGGTDYSSSVNVFAVKCFIEGTQLSDEQVLCSFDSIAHTFEVAYKTGFTVPVGTVMSVLLVYSCQGIGNYSDWYDFTVSE